MKKLIDSILFASAATISVTGILFYLIDNKLYVYALMLIMFSAYTRFLVTEIKLKLVNPLTSLWETLNKFSDYATYKELTTVEQITDILSILFTDLIHKNHLLEKEYESRSQFFSNMSHEIRTPINAIIGLTDLALSYNVDQKTNNYLHRIAKSSNTLMQIINDILDFSKISNNQLKLRETEFNLIDLTEHVVYMFDSMQTKPIELVLNIDCKANLVVRGDERRVEQILFNIISNSFKFTNCGQILVKLEVNVVNGHAYITYTVVDTGIGIEQEKLDHIFKPFTQIDPSMTRKFTGTGIGLTVCNMLATLMGAQLRVVSEVNEGSTFTFDVVLPIVEHLHHKLLDANVLVIDKNIEAGNGLRNLLCLYGVQTQHITDLSMSYRLQDYNIVMMDTNADMEDVERIKKECEALGIRLIYMWAINYFDNGIKKPLYPSSVMSVLDQDFAIKPLNNVVDDKIIDQLFGARILVVEDNFINQQVVTEILNGVGCVVTIADNGKCALELGTDFDCVLMDIQMPVMDGYTCCTKIREMDKNIPILAMTAHARDEDIRKSYEVGMNDHITKPFDKQRLFSTLIENICIDVDVCERKKFAKKVDETAYMLKIYGIDIATGMSRVNNNFSVYKKILESLVFDFDRLFDEPCASDTIHGLKGAAGNIGAIKLHELCKTDNVMAIRNEYLTIIDSIKQNVELGTHVNIEAMIERGVADIEQLRTVCDCTEKEELLTAIAKNPTNINLLKDFMVA